MNRLYFAECDANLCLNGNKCQNRRFQNREWHKVQLRKAGKKGFGLFANERIQKYDFIIEYVGAVIDAKEAKFRLRHQYFGSSNFYILSLGGGYLIDATVKGSMARFANHSCCPICITQKWSVLGQARVGLFALCDIEKGDELSFDYQFISYGKDKQACFCGADNCRKWLEVKAVASKHKKQKKTPRIKLQNRINYRCLNEGIQCERHSNYFERLLRNKHYGNSQGVMVLDEQIAKGMVCGRISIECNPCCSNTDDNDFDAEQANKFDALLYQIHHQKKELKVNQIKSIAELMQKE